MGFWKIFIIAHRSFHAAAGTFPPWLCQWNAEGFLNLFYIIRCKYSCFYRFTYLISTYRYVRALTKRKHRKFLNICIIHKGNWLDYLEVIFTIFLI